MRCTGFAFFGLAFALIAPAQAARFLDDRVSVNGFGTLGAVYNHHNDAEYIRDITQEKGPVGGWSGDVDSRLGLQLGWRFDTEFDLVVQGVSRYNQRGNYEPQLTWAFLRYAPDPGLQLRVGRVGLDTYMLADSRDVGYSYLWMRPPVDYYGIRHLTHLDGVDLVLRRPLGTGLLWGKLYVGLADERIAGEAEGLILDAAGSRIHGGHINYEQGGWRLQLGATELRYRFSAPSGYHAEIRELENLAQSPFLSAETRSALLITAALMRDIVKPVNVRLSSVGVAYDQGPFQAQAMLGYTNRPEKEFDTTSAFATVGYRLRQVTPYITLSLSHTDGVRLRDLGLPLEGTFGVTQRTLSLGARYDFATNLAAKTQFDLVDVRQTGLLWRRADPSWQGTATIFSLGLDFIF